MFKFGKKKLKDDAKAPKSGTAPAPANFSTPSSQKQSQATPAQQQQQMPDQKQQYSSNGERRNSNETGAKYKEKSVADENFQFSSSKDLPPENTPGSRPGRRERNLSISRSGRHKYMVKKRSTILDMGSIDNPQVQPTSPTAHPSTTGLSPTASSPNKPATTTLSSTKSATKNTSSSSKTSTSKPGTGSGRSVGSTGSGKTATANSVCRDIAQGSSAGRIGGARMAGQATAAV